MVMNTVPAQRRAPTSDHSIFADVDRHRRFSCFGCQTLGCGAFLILLLLVGTALYGIAATGAVRVPGLSQLAYPVPPAPARQVAPESFDLVALPKQVVLTADGTTTLTLTEGQLTSLVSADRLPAFRQSQIIAEPGQLSFSGYYVNNPVGDPLFLRLNLGVDGSTNRCALRSVAVGRLDLPLSFAQSIGQVACQTATELLSIDQYVVTNLTAGNGSATAVLEPRSVRTSPDSSRPAGQ